jgi:forkhead box protein N
MAPIKLEESDACMRARLVESLSQSFPGSALSRALHAMTGSESDCGGDSDCDDFACDLEDALSASCFSEIRLDKVKIEEGGDDEELTSLSWLQDGDLLKNLNTEVCSSPLDDIKENTDQSPAVGTPHPPNVPYNPQKHINSKPPYSFSCLIFMAIEDAPMKKLPVKDIYHWILTHFPYFQNAPTGWKNSVRHNLSLNKCFKKVEKEKGQVRMID